MEITNNAHLITRSRRSRAVIHFHAQSLHRWTVSPIRGRKVRVRSYDPAICQSLLREVRKPKTILYMPEVMDPHTLEALKLSIAHWERLASGKRKRYEAVDVDGCALCEMFNTPVKETEMKCAGCPVFEKTKQQFCRGTPFVEAEKLSDCEQYAKPLDSDEFKEAAELELEFLRSLLPPVEK